MSDDKYLAWRGDAGHDKDFELDLTAEFEYADEFLTWLFGEPLGYFDYIRDRNRQFIVKALIDDVEYDSSNIVDFKIENSLSLSDQLELGTAIPNKLEITLRLKSEIPPNAKIIPYLSLAVFGLGRVTDWMPMGHFYVDDRVKSGNVWTFTCYDKLVWADVPFISTLSYPASHQAVWDEICDRLGYTYDNSVVIDPAYIFGAGPAGFTMRQVLGYIASASGASLFFDKDEVLGFKRFVADDDPVWEFTTSDYMRVKQTNPLKTYTRVVVTYDTADDLTYEAGTGDENHTLYIENPFMTQEMTDDLLDQLNGFSYMPITMDAKGFPHLNQGDIVKFSQREGLSWNDTITSWDNTHMPWDGIIRYQSIILHQVFSFKGGLGMKIEAPSVSEQQSEFKVANTLMQQVNLIAERATEDSVKLNKAYFGVNISREEGLIVEREDNASKVILNSDEMTFYQGSEKALYFDAVEGRYVFNGIVEGAEFVGGVITGAKYQTSVSSYPRVEISATANLIEAAQNQNNKISLSSMFGESSSPALVFNSQSGSHTLPSYAYQIGDFFNIISLLNMRLTTTENLVLNPTGVVTVPNWSRLRNSATNQTLQQALNDAGGTTGKSASYLLTDGTSFFVFVFQNGLLKDVHPL